MSLFGERVLVTGAFGSVGTALVPALEDAGARVWAYDIDQMDVTEYADVGRGFRGAQPSLVFHLAAEKHAPDGETNPAATTSTNVGGTAFVLAAADDYGARVILASSCKACDPETVYGASKLIAERLVLNAGGSVVRFFNIPESSGNVFAVWRSLDDDDPIPVTPCTRYFQTLDQAVALLIAAVDLPPGRYCVDPGEPRRMLDVARETYPGRDCYKIAPRRGDRLNEPLCATHEQLSDVQIDGAASNFFQIQSQYDPVPDFVSGGMITGPTLSVIGNGDSPEEVVPF